MVRIGKLEHDQATVLTLFLLDDVDRPDEEVDAVVTAVVVTSPLGEDVLVLSAIVGPERLTLAAPGHRRGVNVGLLVLILLPAVPLPPDDVGDAAVVVRVVHVGPVSHELTAHSRQLEN